MDGYRWMTYFGLITHFQKKFMNFFSILYLIDDDYEDGEDEDEYEQEDDHKFYGSELESEDDDFDIMV